MKPTIEQEAKTFAASKRTSSNIKPLTARRYIAGCVLSGLIARSGGSVRPDELKREAYYWADIMLEDD